MKRSDKHNAGMFALSVAALGVVFGDIGTSPLYAIKEIFSIGNNILELNEANLLGILSLIFWSLISVVSFKYITFIMNANNHGEGGIMALLALAIRKNRSKRNRFLILTIGMMGACMFYADGMITPAISVMSAVEGIEFITPTFHNFIIPITLVIIFGLFWAQSKGTSAVGFMFGPIMLFWFLTLAGLGIYNILQAPFVLYALNPFYAFQFLTNEFSVAFITLGAVVLVVTGAESLYADMGHFGREPVKITWFSFVFPSLTLNYFGQGALIINNPSFVKNPFYLMAPEWMLIPLVILATLATIIASQACITGAFSVSRQALQLGFIPRMRVDHTSENQEGQIYLPRVNWILMAGVMAVVLIFQNSSALAGAYGVAITIDFVITTILASFVFTQIWRWHWIKTMAVIILFLIVDLIFFGANIIKVLDGGWFPLLIGAILIFLMSTWKRGRSLLFYKLKDESMSIDTFLKSMRGQLKNRVKGTAVFLTPNPDGVPHALLHNLKHNKIVHRNVILLSIRFKNYPHATSKNFIEFERLPNNFFKIILNYGFKDETRVPRDLKRCEKFGLKLDPMDTSYFIGKESLIPHSSGQMFFFRKKVFITLFRSAENITNQFYLPANRVVELGSQVLF
ncbi:MAG: potassium transporter Kup [Methylophilaceae bacterium]|nr:potassium transporter Kup [Methylophilaceae bacterium]MBL6727059.1 potassium transporter Kup [Methylophilaceae bacterium]MBL6791662.1 potassium transporter Kup [Methylophilaceae bacterium]